jgi:hypothetical protein
LRRSDERDLAVRWSGRLSLTKRILAVNIFVLAMLAGSLFYLDSYRHRSTDARLDQAKTEVRMAADALAMAPAEARETLIDLHAAGPQNGAVEQECGAHHGRPVRCDRRRRQSARLRSERRRDADALA